MTARRQILIVFAHPNPRKSRVNRRMLAAVRDLDHVIVSDLYEQYPDFYIDVDREQAQLVTADFVIFQHPVYWYSAPALLKQWQDAVLVEGFAFGREGTALRGKDFMLAISTGGAPSAYRRGGIHHFAIEELMHPLEQTARFCGMHYQKPFLVQSALELDDQAIDNHARDYRRFLQAYRENRA